MVYRAKPLAERFWKKVNRRTDSECWLWTGSRTKSGYGLLGTTRATHISLELSGRPRSAGSIALHNCDNPICVNPNHLRWGTDADNVADMVSRRRHQANRRENCVRGHPFAGDNLIQRANGQRGCRACQRQADAAYKQRRREKHNAI